jgi:hypothetical protein
MATPERLTDGLSMANFFLFNGPIPPVASS